MKTKKAMECVVPFFGALTICVIEEWRQTELEKRVGRMQKIRLGK
jgi:hypothetical protein